MNFNCLVVLLHDRNEFQITTRMGLREKITLAQPYTFQILDEIYQITSFTLIICCDDHVIVCLPEATWTFRHVSDIESLHQFLDKNLTYFAHANQSHDLLFSCTTCDT